VVFRFRPQSRLDPQRLVTLVQRRKDVVLVPPAGLRLDLRAAATTRPTPADRSAAPAAGRRPPVEAQRASPWPDLGRRALTSDQALATVRAGSVRQNAPGQPASWWTARATAGEVAPGFSKAEILKPAAEDPRGEQGVFTRVSQVLGELLR
jgi:hypothetical protein